VVALRKHTSAKLELDTSFQGLMDGALADLDIWGREHVRPATMDDDVSATRKHDGLYGVACRHKSHDTVADFDAESLHILVSNFERGASRP